jgi:hypothetical protein
MRRTVARLLGALVVLDTDDEELAHYLAALFSDVLVASDVVAVLPESSGLHLVPNQRPERAVHAAIRADGERLRLVVDGIEVGRSREGWWVLAMLIWCVNQRVIEVSSTTSLLLHAGGVVRDGRALLILGASGAGKTTTTLAFARTGWGYLTDDVAVLGADGQVRGSPKPPTVRSGTSELLGLGEEHPRRPERYQGGNEWWAPATGLGATISRAAPLSGVLVLSGDPTLDAAQESLTRSGAVARVAEHAFNLGLLGQSGLESLAQHVKRGTLTARVHPDEIVRAVTVEFDRG